MDSSTKLLSDLHQYLHSIDFLLEIAQSHIQSMESGFFTNDKVNPRFPKMVDEIGTRPYHCETLRLKFNEYSSSVDRFTLFVKNAKRTSLIIDKDHSDSYNNEKNVLMLKRICIKVIMFIDEVRFKKLKLIKCDILVKSIPDLLFDQFYFEVCKLQELTDLKYAQSDLDDIEHKINNFDMLRFLVKADTFMKYMTYQKDRVEVIDFFGSVEKKGVQGINPDK